MALRTQRRRVTLGRVECIHDFDVHGSGQATPSFALASPTASPRASDSWAKLRRSVGAAAAFRQALQISRHQRAAIIWASLATVLSGCTSCVPFELLNKADRGCADLILFAQYAYAAFECLVSGHVREFVFERKIPLSYHLVVLLLERGRNALYNAGLGLGLPMPAYLVIKNSGLVVSMALGWALQSKRYARAQVLGVLAITVGVIAATFASRPASSSSPTTAIDGGTFVTATALMLGGVVTTALMNVAQEFAFSKHGQHFQESMFYSNVLGLPLFLFNSGEMLSHVQVWSSRWEPLPLPAPFNVAVPFLWLLLLLNIASQSVMKVSCLKLTGLAGSVANVIVVTVFRFLSLVLSACVLNSPPFPPASFWIGGLLVLAGTLAYVISGPTGKPAPKKE